MSGWLNSGPTFVSTFSTPSIAPTIARSSPASGSSRMTFLSMMTVTRPPCAVTSQ